MFVAYKAYSVDTEACIVPTITTDNFRICCAFQVLFQNSLQKRLIVRRKFTVLMNKML